MMPARVVVVHVDGVIWLRVYDQGEVIAVQLKPHAAALLVLDLLTFLVTGQHWPEARSEIRR
jgi:hypothetical protein